MSYTIVGVIGHIDHGKTSLVAALTGVDTDTHAEEKRRGITIDLGFAAYTDGDHQFALIDAPGHQKYIGNLLAGVSAVDVGLLVVACDQGIQAQTLEHAAILQYLGVDKLIVAISRVDLADEATREELAEELDLFLADYGFHSIPKVSVSSVTGEGLEELRDMLSDCARTASRAATGLFRMPIDRVFTIEGRGCVVAGTLWSGQVAVGDHVELSRTGESLRVRELEVHGETVSQSQVGFRTAMNLVGASALEIARGDELVSPSSHQACTRLVVQLTLFSDAAEVRSPTTVQFHTATSAFEARISGVKRIGPGETAIVIVDVERPVIATYLQQCLFRRPYPVGSFAGGRVLGAVEPGLRQTKRLLQLGEKLSGGDAAERLIAWVDFYEELVLDDQWLELQVGIGKEHVAAIVEQCAKEGHFRVPVDGRLVSNQAYDRARQYVVKLLTQQAETTEDAWMVEHAVHDRAQTAASATVIAQVIDELVREKILVRVRKMVAVASEQTVLSKKQKARMEKMLAMYSDSRTPPTLKEAAASLETTIDAVASLVRFATQQKVLIDLGNGFFMADATFRVLCRELKALFDQSPQQTVSTIRDQWKVTRKHAIPLLEYCDQVGVTQRQGDARVAGTKLELYLEPEVSEGQVIE